MLPPEAHTFPALKREYCGQPGQKLFSDPKKAFEMKLMACNKAWTVDLLLWKPYWCLFNRLLVFKY